MKSCSFCLESIDISMISYCTNCIDSGNTCHSCENHWVEQRKDPNICTICKQNTKENISVSALAKYHIYQNQQNPLYTTSISQIRSNPLSERNIQPIVRVETYRHYVQEVRCMICMLMSLIMSILIIALIFNIYLASKRK